jgi:hypothetical protein
MLVRVLVPVPGLVQARALETWLLPAVEMGKVPEDKGKSLAVPCQES